jgi:hypothetical protein
MDLKNMRENGVRGLLVCCLKCGAQRVVNVDDQSENLTVESFGPRMVCYDLRGEGCGRPAKLERSSSTDSAALTNHIRRR